MHVQENKSAINTPLESENQEVIGQVSLQPGQQSSFVVGIFESPIPQPSVTLELEPKDCKIDSSLVRADERGDYRLTYYFKNLHSMACTVTVRSAAIA